MYHINILLFLCFLHGSSVYKKTLLMWQTASRKPSVCTMYIMMSAKYGTDTLSLYIYILAASAARGALPQNHVYVRFMFVFVVI
jgi:hypothetical protein